MACPVTRMGSLKADGVAVDFIAEMRNSYLKKTGQVLFISQKSETELESELRAENRELISECWTLFLDRPQGFYKLDHPAGIFLNELPNFMETAR